VRDEQAVWYNLEYFTTVHMVAFKQYTNIHFEQFMLLNDDNEVDKN